MLPMFDGYVLTRSRNLEPVLATEQVRRGIAAEAERLESFRDTKVAVEGMEGA